MVISYDYDRINSMTPDALECAINDMKYRIEEEENAVMNFRQGTVFRDSPGYVGSVYDDMVIAQREQLRHEVPQIGRMYEILEVLQKKLAESGLGGM